jgi:hypothetical protein
MPDPIQLPLVDGVLYIDNSSMELFTTCPRQAYYYVIRRLELNRDRIALSFGEAFHRTLEYLYKTYGTAYRSATENADVIRFASSLRLDTPEDDYRTIPYLVNGVNKYLTDHPAEPFEIVRLPNGSPAVELPFAYPLGVIDSPVYGRISIIWTGKIDLLYRLDGRLGVMDHKTSSIMGQQFFAEFEIAHQMYGYNSAAEYIINEPLSQICINGLGCRKPTRTGVMYEFSRHIIPVSRPLVNEWHDDCLAIVSNFISQCETGYLAKHTKWCINKYGPCQYRGICTLDPEMRESALNTTEFRPVTWNPLSAKT